MNIKEHFLRWKHNDDCESKFFIFAWLTAQLERRSRRCFDDQLKEDLIFSAFEEFSRRVKQPNSYWESESALFCWFNKYLRSHRRGELRRMGRERKAYREMSHLNISIGDTRNQLRKAVIEILRYSQRSDLLSKNSRELLRNYVWGIKVFLHQLRVHRILNPDSPTRTIPTEVIRIGDVIGDWNSSSVRQIFPTTINELEALEFLKEPGEQNNIDNLLPDTPTSFGTRPFRVAKKVAKLAFRANTNHCADKPWQRLREELLANVAPLNDEEINRWICLFHNAQMRKHAKQCTELKLVDVADATWVADTLSWYLAFLSMNAKKSRENAIPIEDIKSESERPLKRSLMRSRTFLPRFWENRVGPKTWDRFLTGYPTLSFSDPNKPSNPYSISARELGPCIKELLAKLERQSDNKRGYIRLIKKILTETK